MSVIIKKLKPIQFPKSLLEIPQPPKQLFIRGAFPEKTKFLTVVGSRRFTSYGKQACEKIINELAGYNITIVSGLALGIDAIAHKTALENNLKTIAVPGSGLADEVIYPRTNLQLAKSILDKEGCLLSEFEPEFKATQWSFPQRNRIMAGLSDAILIIEAEPKSGTLITARMGTDYNKNVLSVPGSIFSNTSKGTNQLLKLGSQPIQSGDDILEIFGIDKDKEAPSQEKLFEDCSDEEKLILSKLSNPITRDDLIELLPNIKIDKIEATITLLEIKGYIKEQMGKIFRVK